MSQHLWVVQQMFSQWKLSLEFDKVKEWNMNVQEKHNLSVSVLKKWIVLKKQQQRQPF